MPPEGPPPNWALDILRTSLITSYPVISEAQKQARLGWSTVKMARHYTGVVPEEDCRAAEHIGGLLAGVAAPTN